MNRKDYKIINLLFAGIIGMVFLYSGIFSAELSNHPIPSACPTGNCSSTGLSRAFSEIIRFRFDSALAYNPASIWVFSFFFIQFFMRFFIIRILNSNLRTNIIIVSDVIISIILYGITFRQIF
ncbi:MAG: DUF2752 domain-containing protein [Bacteroidales bacterium]|nr:DUF2752 domain-containing protein [Bacteroidales bacterium]